MSNYSFPTVVIKITDYYILQNLLHPSSCCCKLHSGTKNKSRYNPLPTRHNAVYQHLHCIATKNISSHFQEKEEAEQEQEK